MNEGAAGTRFKIDLELARATFVAEPAIPGQNPRRILLRVALSGSIVLGEAAFQVLGESRVKAFGILFAPQQIIVVHDVDTVLDAARFCEKRLRGNSGCSPSPRLRRSCAKARSASVGEAPEVGFGAATLCLEGASTE